MSIFLGKLNKYFKNQKPIDLLTYKYQFEDPEFPCENDKMIYSSNEAKNKIFIETIKKQYNLDEKQDLKIVYYPIKDIFSNIFDEKIDCTKFVQNSIGNCYFLNVISLLSNYGQLLTQIFRIDKMNLQGYYEICLFIDGQWQIVIIDDYIPFIVVNDEEGNENSYIIGCSPAQNCDCCYFILLEKAFAKAKGSYVDMIGGFSGEVFQTLTGFSYMNIKHELRTKEQIFDYINGKLRDSEYLFCCNSKKELVGETHAFSVLNTEKIKFGTGDNQISLIQLRNPWGSTIVGNKTIKVLLTEENKRKLLNKFKTFSEEEDNGIMWVDDINYKTNFNITQCCFSKFGSYVHSFRFNNVEKDREHNIFINKEGKLIFKLELKKDSKMILSYFFNYDGPNLKFECYNCDSANNGEFSLNMEFALKKGNYIIIGSFDNVDINRDYIYLIINLFCVDVVTFDFICSRPKNEKNIIYKNLFNNKSYEDLKRTKLLYKHCEELRDKFLYHQTLIKFFREKLGCEFTLSGKGFYLDTYSNNKVECMIRIDKNKRSKFKQIVASQYIKPNKIPEKEIYVGTSHLNGEIISRGEVWKIKEICDISNIDKKLEAKCIFRGEIEQNKIKESKKEVIKDEQVSEFKEDEIINLEKKEKEEIKKKKIVSIEIIDENNEEGILRLKSKLVINKKTENKILSPFHKHYLYLSITERFLNCNYSCNICQKEFNNNAPSYYCTICDYDLCEECAKITELNDKNEEDTNYSSEGFFWQFKSKTHNNHQLTLLRLKNIIKPFDCEVCKQSIDPEDYFYFCSGCEYFLCEECKLKEKKGNPLQFSPYWHEHPLSLCLPIIPQKMDKFTCNHCSTESKIQFHYYCTKCDYHLCSECSSKYANNFNDITIRTEKNEIEPDKNIDIFDFQFKLKEHIHPLTICLFNYYLDNDKYFRCHICSQKIKRMEVFYLCSLCDFKYCKMCINKIIIHEKMK